jgi:hypothetical protein
MQEQRVVNVMTATNFLFTRVKTSAVFGVQMILELVLRVLSSTEMAASP